MILTFSKKQFAESILSGSKIHTIRQDKKNRWKAGMKIHFWSGNPRNVKNNPYQFGYGFCTKVEDIQMDFVNNSAVISCKFLKGQNILDELAKNDGFENWWQLKKWFCENGHEHFFTGKLIHFHLLNSGKQP